MKKSVLFVYLFIIFIITAVLVDGNIFSASEGESSQLKLIKTDGILMDNIKAESQVANEKTAGDKMPIKDENYPFLTSHIDRLEAKYRGYSGFGGPNNPYANETNKEFLFSMARQGDFDAQEMLIARLSPTMDAYLKHAQSNTPYSNALKLVESFTEFYGIDQTLKYKEYLEAIMIAAAYGRTSFLNGMGSAVLLLENTDDIPSSKAITYAGVLDDDVVSISTLELINSSSRKEFPAKDKRAGEKLYQTILDKRKEIGISSDVITSEKHLQWWGENQVCKHNPKIYMSDPKCDPLQ